MIDYNKKSVSWLKKKAWEYFSIYIRKRDKGKCYTCKKVKPWKAMQAGHMISCTCEELRFHTKNVHCQCFSCNIMKHGNLDEYILNFKKDYGIELFDKFMKIKHQSSKHWKPQELINIIKKYKKYAT